MIPLVLLEWLGGAAFELKLVVSLESSPRPIYYYLSSSLSLLSHSLETFGLSFLRLGRPMKRMGGCFYICSSFFANSSICLSSSAFCSSISKQAYYSITFTFLAFFLPPSAATTEANYGAAVVTEAYFGFPS